MAMVMEPYYSNNRGHGHVFAREDRTRARCGGPSLCSFCRSDEAQLNRLLQSTTAVAPKPSVPASIKVEINHAIDIVHGDTPAVIARRVLAAMEQMRADLTQMGLDLSAGKLTFTDSTGGGKLNVTWINT